MGKATKPSAARLRQILKRQDPPAWGKDYIPAILATREEAPPGSRPCQIWSPKLGRTIHTLSSVETDIALIALYHPRLVNLHEQRMLACLPSMHPLHGHPRTQGLTYPVARGTVAVAAAINALEYHAIIKVPATDSPNDFFDVPFPYVGDFLLFLEDHQGLFCVNWTVKASADQFSNPFDEKIRRNEGKARAKVEARHAIEKILYADFEIPTHPLTSESYNHDVVKNLAQIYGWQIRPISVHPDLISNVVDRFNAGLAIQARPIDVITTLSCETDLSPSAIKTIFYQAVWNRQLRPDLFQPLLMDQPLLPETCDVLEIYQSWFKGACA